MYKNAMYKFVLQFINHILISTILFLPENSEKSNEISNNVFERIICQYWDSAIYYKILNLCTLNLHKLYLLK